MYPSLYQINTRVWLTKLSHELGKPATLDDIPDRDLDQVAEKGFDWIWFLSVWQTGCASQKVSRSLPELRKEFEETLPDLREEDIGGSGFAITRYTAHANLGGERALHRLREREVICASAVYISMSRPGRRWYSRCDKHERGQTNSQTIIHGDSVSLCDAGSTGGECVRY